MKILLAGGGSGGAVAPLLAVAEELRKRHPKAKFLLVGTKAGPERLMVEKAGIAFLNLLAGKWRRYFSLANFASPFLTLAGFLKAFKILREFQADCVFGAGSFVQVPVVWAAWFLKIPVVLHQQDVSPSLANTLCQLFAKKITVSFESSVTDFASGWGIFYKKRKAEKVIWTGNPCRLNLQSGDRERALKRFHLASDFPVFLVMGGGTGAAFLNTVVVQALPELTKTVQILHATGKNKFSSPAPNYHPYEFISETDLAYAAADIVLSRAGMSTITELANARKVSIIVALPHSHQESNALVLFKRQAALVLPQEGMNPKSLVEVVKKLLFDAKLQNYFKENIARIMPPNANREITGIIEKLILREA